MPFESGAALVGGNLDGQLQSTITTFLKRVDAHVARICQERRLFPAQIRLLQPVNYCAIASANEVFIIASNRNTGGMPRQQFIDWADKDMNLQVALHLAQRDLAFEEPFGLVFERNTLDLPDDQKDARALVVAEAYVRDEMLNLERLQRMVRITPMFHGRDFLINDRLFFVLSPFAEPFNTIFQDHVKPTIERLGDYSCIRADDIYDNRPIIEDIWRCINEARVVIAELTDRNPNVFYEAGISHTVGKEVILLTQTMDDVPFDLRHLRCIVYDYTPRGVQTLETNLRNTVEGILRRR